MRCDWRGRHLRWKTTNESGNEEKKDGRLLSAAVQLIVGVFKTKKKQKQKILTFPQTQLLEAWAIDNSIHQYSFQVLTPYPHMVDWTKGIIIQTTPHPPPHSKSRSHCNNYWELTASEKSEIRSQEEKIKI